jgi:ribonuclease P protein component
VLSSRPRHETHVPASQHPPRPHARLPRPHGDAWRSKSPREPPPQGAEAPHADDLQEVGALTSSVFGFGKERRVRTRPEFLFAQSNGRRVTTPNFTLLVAARMPRVDRGSRATGGEQPPPVARLGMVVTKKVGSSPERNRVRRVCRECFRTWPGMLPPGVDFIVIPKSGAVALGLAEVRAEWERVKSVLDKRCAEALARGADKHHVSARPPPRAVRK